MLQIWAMISDQMAFSLVYVHYIIIFLRNADKYLSHVSNVLWHLNQTSVTLSTENCKLFTKLID